MEDGLITLEATVGDEDPRVWPSVLDALLRAGALEAWLTPVMLAGGRPGTCSPPPSPPATSPTWRPCGT